MRRFLLVLLLALLPASDLATSLVQRLVAVLARPRHLPRLDFESGVPEQAETMVVIPTLLDSVAGVRELVDHLEVQALGNLDPNIHFVWTEIGDCVREQNRMDEALKLYMKAQNTYASDRMARAGAALVYESKGDIKHALDEWSAYIRMDCCSEYSNTVAKQKIQQLKLPVDPAADPAGTAPAPGPAPSAAPG